MNGSYARVVGQPGECTMSGCGSQSRLFLDFRGWRTLIERSLSCAWHLPDITWTGSLVAQHSTRSGRKGGLQRTCLVMDSALKRLQQAVADEMEGLSNEDLRWRLPGKWCAAEVLEHLYLTYTGTMRGLERVLAGGKPIVHPATLRQSCRTLVVVGPGYMPGGRKSPRVAQPRGVPAEKRSG
jgi:hypothetical protein